MIPSHSPDIYSRTWAYEDLPLVGCVKTIPEGCSKRPFSKAAASEEG
jgi:hypothetical protein